jgi:hypothetical protein
LCALLLLLPLPLLLLLPLHQLLLHLQAGQPCHN